KQAQCPSIRAFHFRIQFFAFTVVINCPGSIA
ncbi:MAG: hypothetical protein ACI89U_002661, partial [Gammaproteobacteria bacterium]